MAPVANVPDMLPSCCITADGPDHQAAGSSTYSRYVKFEELDCGQDGSGGAGLLGECEASADRECDPSKCLFCNRVNSNVDSNIDHMRLAHGFIIPEKHRLVVELETLVDYFHLIIFGYFECLCCGSQRHTGQAAQQHMVSKGHCKFDLFDEASEFRDFYDFGPDGHGPEGRADGAKGAGPSKSGQMNDSTLRLPSGKLLSHRLSRETRLCHRKPNKEEITLPGPRPEPDSNSDSTAKTTLTRAQRRQESFATRQLMCLSANDRRSLIHLPMSQQLAIIAVGYAQIAKAMRAKRAIQSLMDKRWNRVVRQ